MNNCISQVGKKHMKKANAPQITSSNSRFSCALCQVNIILSTIRECNTLTATSVIFFSDFFLDATYPFETVCP